jgi:hypothetical protein
VGVACPTCRRAIDWNEQFPFRPFCSERCRLVDFGAWASGAHAIPGETVDDVLVERQDGVLDDGPQHET